MIAQFVLGVWDGVLEGFAGQTLILPFAPHRSGCSSKETVPKGQAQNFTITRKWLYIIIVSEFAAFFGFKSLRNVLNRDSDKVRSARVDMECANEESKVL